MHGFYAGTGPAPLDQADGLRRLFGGERRRIVPLVANPHVAFTSVVLERATAALAAPGQHVLLVDAADNAPPPHELAPVNLAGCIERLSAEVSYLAARGLPRAFVDTRGSAAALLDRLADAAPEADILLVHADAPDLARLLGRRPARPVLLSDDAAESLKHAYAGLKLLAQRCGWLTFDLLLAAPPSSRRLAAIADSLARCADGFLGALLQDWAVVDPASDVRDAVEPALARLLSAQLALGEAAVPAPPPAVAARQAFPI